MAYSYSYSYIPSTSSPTPSPSSSSSCLLFSASVCAFPEQFPASLTSFLTSHNINVEGFFFITIAVIAIFIVTVAKCCCSKNKVAPVDLESLDPHKAAALSPSYTRKPAAVTFDLALIEFEGPGPTGKLTRSHGFTVQRNPLGEAIVSKVVDGSEAADLDLKVGDVIHWPGSGGTPAPYATFFPLRKSRPLRFDVYRPATSTPAPEAAGIVRSVSGVTRPNSPRSQPVKLPTPATTSAAISFILDVDETQLLKLNKAMSRFKQSESVKSLMPIRLSSIKAYTMLPDAHAGATPVISSKVPVTYRTFTGVYNSVQVSKVERANVTTAPRSGIEKQGAQKT